MTPPSHHHPSIHHPPGASSAGMAFQILFRGEVQKKKQRKIAVARVGCACAKLRGSLDLFKQQQQQRARGVASKVNEPSVVEDLFRERDCQRSPESQNDGSGNNKHRTKKNPTQNTIAVLMTQFKDKPPSIHPTRTRINVLDRCRRRRCHLDILLRTCVWLFRKLLLFAVAAFIYFHRSNRRFLVFHVIFVIDVSVVSFCNRFMQVCKL